MGEGGWRHVFVYGTLRRGESNDINRLEPAPAWVGPATVSGSLFDLGAYPGLVLAGTQGEDGTPDGLPHGRVSGEVYRITSALESLLDRIEDVAPEPSGEYRRREVEVIVSGRVLACLVYELTWERALGRLRIDPGDWVAWRRRR